MKTSLENITLVLLCDISTHSTSTEMANYPETRFVGVLFKLRKRMRKSFVRSRSPQNREIDHFMLLFAEDGREMYQNLKHMQYRKVSCEA